MEKVFFIGAGPGDPELITVKGQRIVKEADIIIYAGSLVPKEVIDCHKEGAEIYNSASMTLEEVMEITIEGAKRGKQVARVHTGDPASFGAHREQMDILDEHGIEYEVIPGVSSFLASAAAVKKEFTLPSISQTVICTRLEGRTPVPEKESLESLATHKVKNSWGTEQIYGGYFYASEAFVKYKTMNILVNKEAVPMKILKKLNLK